LHIYFVDVDEASNITAIMRQPLKTSPDYETTDSAQKILPMLIVPNITPYIFLENRKAYGQNSSSLAKGAKTNTLKILHNILIMLY
jgi:hypothetical protein